MPNTNRSRVRKIPRLSAELTAVILSSMLSAIDDKDSTLALVPRLLASPEDPSNMLAIEDVITRKLEEAVYFVCLASLGEKLLNQETSARASVSLLYLAFRGMVSNGKVLSKKDSEELWNYIWSFARHIPRVSFQMEEEAEKGDLEGWKSEVQNFARRRWRTLKDQQVPRLRMQTEELRARVFALLNIERTGASIPNNPLAGRKSDF